MRDTIVENLTQRFAAFDDLLEQVAEDDLGVKLEVAKHKSLVEHLWCVVGARESYVQALVAGEWQGFACSMQAYTKADFTDKLGESSELVEQTLANIQDWTAQREELLAALYEHEVMHEGQIIRHVYGMGGKLPATFKWA